MLLNQSSVCVHITFKAWDMKKQLAALGILWMSIKFLLYFVLYLIIKIQNGIYIMEKFYCEGIHFS